MRLNKQNIEELAAAVADILERRALTARPKYISTEQVAEMLCVTPNTVRHMDLPRVKLGENKQSRTLYREADIRAYIARRAGVKPEEL